MLWSAPTAGRSRRSRSAPATSATAAEDVRRRPRARAARVGRGGEGMAEGARIPLPYPEVAVVERETLEEQTDAVAEALAERPIVVGGCCCAHVGAARGLARRVERLAVVWIDSHGDLNTPETSPSGNLWGMPFRMILDSGVVAPEDAALVGARNLDPPERSSWRRPASTTRSSARSRESTRRTWRSTSTCSIRARSTSSSPSRTVPRPTSRSARPRHRRAHDDRRHGRHRLPADGPQRGARRTDARGGRILTLA